MRREPWVDEHLAQIEAERRTVAKALRRARNRGNLGDARELAGIDRSLQWTACYLETRPWLPPDRDAERPQSNVRRVIPVDPATLPLYGGTPARPSAWDSNLTDEQRSALEQALSVLSNREREVFVMCKALLMTHTEIAKALKLSRGNVYNLLTRAEAKLAQVKDDPVQTSFFVGQSAI